MTLLSEVHPDGTYGVTLRRGETSRWLTREQVYAHAAEVVTAARRAEYDAALLRQLHGELGLPVQEVGMTVQTIREQRVPLDVEALNPLRLEPCATPEGKAFLVLSIGAHKVGQWTPGDARRHAMACLDLAEVVRLDNGYFAFLTGGDGVPEGPARAAVAGLMKFMTDDHGDG